MLCKICNTELKFHDKSLILNKYMINYYFCSNCYFIQTEEPYWLDEAYNNAIAFTDTGIIARNFINSDNLLLLLKYFPEGKYLDYGGGHGILTRIMRDYGYDFYHYDKYAENLYAKYFEGNTNNKYNIITLFENLEHFTFPLEELSKLFSLTDTIIFSTVLYSKSPPLVKDWWYYSTTTGQHVSFFTKKTLMYIANNFNSYLLSNDYNLHIITKHNINKNLFRKINNFNYIKNKLNLSKYLKKKSKTYQDMLTAINNNIANQNTTNS